MTQLFQILIHTKFLHIQIFSTYQISPHQEVLYIQNVSTYKIFHTIKSFYMDNVRGIRDKYQVCLWLSIFILFTSLWSSLIREFIMKSFSWNREGWWWILQILSKTKIPEETLNAFLGWENISVKNFMTSHYMMDFCMVPFLLNQIQILQIKTVLFCSAESM